MAEAQDYPTKARTIGVGDPISIELDRWHVMAAFAGAGAGTAASGAVSLTTAVTAVLICASLIALAIWFRRRDDYHRTALLMTGTAAAVVPAAGLAVMDEVASPAPLAAAAVALLLACVAGWRHLKVRADAARAPNALRDHFSAANVLEVDGVQFAMFPPLEPLRRLENANFVVWVQNAMNAPRMVRLRLEEGRKLGTRLAQLVIPQIDAVRVDAGEGGWLVAQLLVQSHASEPVAYIHPTIVVEREVAGEGERRLLWRARPAANSSLGAVRFWTSRGTLGLTSSFHGVPYQIANDEPAAAAPSSSAPHVVWCALRGKELEEAIRRDAASRLH